MTQPFDYIGKYAQLRHTLNQCRARGLQPPPDVVQGIQHIESLARTRLTPQQLQEASRHVEHAMVNLQRQTAEVEHLALQRQADSKVDKLVGGLTTGMLGQKRLTREQLEAITTGQPLRAKPTRTTLTQQQKDDAIRDMTRHYDPAGKGWNEKEWIKRLDEVTDASPKEFSRLAAQYNADPAKIKETATRWRDHRIEMALQERRAARNPDPDGPVLTKVDPDTTRRAHIVRAVMETTANEMEAKAQRGEATNIDREFGDDLSRDQLQEDTRRGAIARAFVASEQRGE